MSRKLSRFKRGPLTLADVGHSSTSLSSLSSLHGSTNALAAPSNGTTNQFNGKGVAAAPETVYKMSKKIAQLTRVVYYLNTKHEDHQVELDGLREAYEEECSRIIQDAKSKITALDSARLAGEAEINATKTELDIYRESESMVKTQLAEAMNTVDKLQHDLKMQSDRFGASQADINKAGQEAAHLRAEFENTLQALEESHKASVAGLTKRYEEELKSVRKDRDRIDKEGKAEKESMKRKYETDLSSKDEEIERLRKAAASSQIAFEQAEQLRIAEAEKKLEEAVDVERQRIADREFTIKKLNLTCEEYQKKVNERDTQISNLKLDIKQQQTELSAALAKAERAQADVEAADIRVRAADEREENIKRELARTGDLATELSNAHEAHRQACVDADKYMKDLVVASRSVTELKEKIKSLESSKSSLEKKLKEAAETLKMTVQTHEENAKKALSSQKADLVSNAEFESQKRIHELQDEHRLAIDSKIRDIKELKVALQTKTIAYETLESEYEDTRRKLSSKIDSVESSRGVLSSRLASTQKELDAARNEIDLRMSEIKKLEVQVKTIQEEQATAAARMATMASKIGSRMRDEFKKEKEGIEHHWSKKVKDQMNELRTNLTSQSSLELTSTLSQVERDHNEEIERLQTSHETERKSWASQKSMLERRLLEVATTLSELEIKTESVAKQHQDAMQRLVMRNDERMRNVKDSWDQEWQLREQEAKKEAEKLVCQADERAAIHLKEVEGRWAVLIENMTGLRDQMREKYEQEVEKTNSLESAYTSLQESQAHELLKQAAEYEVKITEAVQVARLECDSVAKIVAEEHKEIINRKVQDVIRLVREVDAHLATAADLKSKIKDLQVLEDHKKALKDLQNDLEVRHAVRTEVVNNDHLGETQRMLKDFDMAQNFLKRQIASLEKRLQEADIKYQNREPREMDIQRISDLEVEVEKKKRRIMALEGELEYCKLELLNREVNYNKVFGTTTRTGVLGSFDSKNSSKSKPFFKSETSLSKLPPLPNPPLAPAANPS
ncbi:hypothetical protein SmJEL517_g02001 [Synchytrium microbalum]|uniref:Protein FAM184A/B N-terminal domain-containing protein n=1 Tax=Synchytrium microbalum TaxID=1806994 RepID=A0A507C9A9_9FUNG|nr:uncharacterized protein SmJEL517_g02001 [Synchytrium microbalum]TPX35759.1 hypothetical protein SmJEL517_g02001 [Synchytrium microbalum]